MCGIAIRFQSLSCKWLLFFPLVKALLEKCNASAALNDRNL